MSAESDAQMQQFTDAVYSQNDSDGALVGNSPLGAIEARSVRFVQWRDTMLGESDAVPEIPERLLRHWVDGDIASFRLLSSIDEEIAADNISANFQNYEAYRVEMQQLAGDVADKVEELKKESLRRGIEQDRVTAKDLVARLRDTDAQAKLPKDTSGLNGFSGGEQSPDHAPDLPAASKVLESITYETRPDGSVLYLLSKRPAFIDHGRHIIVEDKALDDEESILGAILLAKEKYGGAFSLTGTEAFKRKALEVMLKNNVEVRLKSPAQEMLLRDLAVAYPDYKLPASIPKYTQGATGETVQDEALASADAPGAEHSNSSPNVAAVEREEPTPVNRLAGRLVEHGVAPYDHEKGNKESYFVVLENSDGKLSTTWGVGLAQAMETASVAGGEMIELVNNGKKPVTVVKDIKDNHGKVIETETINTHRNEWIVVTDRLTPDAQFVDLKEVTPPALSLVEPIQRPIPTVGEFTPISAVDWWKVQHAVIERWITDNNERDVLLHELGPEPSAGIYYWFDKSGNQVAAPSNAEDLLAIFERTRTAIDSHTAQQESQMTEQNASPGVNQENGDDKKLILRGVNKVGDDYDTTVLLFKGKGDYLQGFMKVDGIKHQVIAHLNERNPDVATGEIKPNFIKLSKAVGQGDDTKWEEFGFGNALNKRNDQKPVYFDDVLFNIGGKTLSARITKNVDEEMHRKLGFVQERVARPERAKAGEQQTEAASDPKAKAPAAQPEAQEPPAAASAPEASAPKKSRSRARA
ncbi:LPD7 domain-containing protein [Pseudomonas chlororaphis]